MAVSFSAMRIGDAYSRKELATAWGYKSQDALRRGVITPAGSRTIVLFVTLDKTAEMTNYRDRLVGDTIEWEADNQLHTLKRITSNIFEPQDEIHLLLRQKKPGRFTYLGRLKPLSVVRIQANGRENGRFLMRLVDNPVPI